MDTPNVMEDRLKLMSRLTTVVVGGEPIEEQAHHLCREIAEAMDVDAVAIRLLRSDQLIMLASLGFSPKQIRSTLPAHLGISGEIIKTRQPVIVDDARTHPLTAELYAKSHLMRDAFRFQSYAGAPLLIEDRLEGIIGIYTSDTPRSFNESDVAFLQIAANHLAAVITNDGLYRRLEHSNVNLRNVLAARLEAEAELKRQQERLERRVEERTAALEMARDEAQRAAEAKSEFLASMSHEIRTPLNAIVGMSQLLVGTEMSEEQREAVETIFSSSRSLLGVINDILDFSKIEVGRLGLENIPFDLRQSLEDAFAIMRQQAGAKELDYRLDIDPTMPRYASGDPTRLRQVLLNLLSNAAKFTSEGGEVCLAASSHGRGADGRLLIHVEVHDSGIGIPAEQVNRLFAPFTQLDSSTSRRYGGSGLGLSICQSLVHLMGGEIGVRSTPGEGSTFWFTVPLEPAPEGFRPDPAAPAAVPRGARRSLRLLVVEDNPVNVKVLVRMLDRLGYHDVKAVEDGASALEAVASGAFDAVLMDCHMPGMDGFEVTRRIRRMEGSLAMLPIIAVTASATVSEQTRCREAGMNDFVAKPVQLASLLEALERVP